MSAEPSGAQDGGKVEVDLGLPDGAPDVVAQAAVLPDVMDDAQEKEALEYLLGPTTVLEYRLPVKIETTKGERTITFRIHQVDTQRLQEIDAEHRVGDGPFAKLDSYAFNIAVALEGTTSIGGLSPQSDRFIGGHPEGAAGALRLRFKGQGGIFDGIASEIQRVSGFSSDRVGTAQRVLVAAAGGS